MKVINYKLQVTMFLVLATCYLLLAPWANAADVSLGIYPPIIQVNTIPPADVQSPLSIINQGDSEINVRIELRPFVSSDQEDGQITYVTPKEANFADPLILDRVKIYDGDTPVDNFSLAPGQKKDLTLRISVPKDSPQTDYYFSIVFLSSPNNNQGVTSSQSLTGIASNVLLSVGQGQVSGNIQEFSAPFLVEGAPVPFTVRIKNTSNHFITPRGEVVISNIFGQKVGKIDLLQTNVLAQSVRNIPSSEFIDESKNLPDQIAAYWTDNFALGPYKATLNIALSDQGPLFSQTIFFLALPYKLIAGLIISVLLLSYVILKVKSKV